VQGPVAGPQGVLAQSSSLASSGTVADSATTQGGSYLGVVDLYGTYYEENYIATGFGAHLALPLMRQHWRADMSEEDARALLGKCMEILFYRDCRAGGKVVFGKATTGGVEVSREVGVAEKWDHSMWLRGTVEMGKMLGASW
jgi:20S proteasome subunit beta 7